jgi:type III secretory pathway component EscV
MPPARAATWRTAALALCAALCVAALCVPLPGVVVDALHVAHLTACAALVALTLRARETRDLAAVPSALALTTVLRLSLEVAFSRAALAGRDVGAISSTLADLVARDGAFAALGAFALLAIAQLVVVARGAERAAEVAARFALDALPGAQLAVDADLRAGAIDPLAARSLRASLDADARLHGALDGALRFVKGDAALGLVAAAVNLLGGTLAATLRDGSSMREAFEHFASLAAGQGVATRVPALAVTTAAALVVTRARRRDDGDARTPSLSVVISDGDLSAVRAACHAALDAAGVDANVEVARGDATTLSIRGAVVARGTREEVVAWSSWATRKHAWRLLGIDEARALVDSVSRDAPALARAAVTSATDLPLLADTLQHLAREGVPLRPMHEVLEHFARHAPKERDATRLGESLRRALGERITGTWAASGSLRAWRLHPELEDALRDHANRRPWERPAADLAADLEASLKSATGDDPRPVVVTDASVRWYLRAAFEARATEVVVIAQQELGPEVLIESRGLLAPE